MSPLASPTEAIVLIPVNRLKPNPWNRTVFDPAALKELAASLKASGVKEPLLVRPIQTSPPAGSGGGPTIVAGDGTPDGSPASDCGGRRPDTTYQIASGHRRWLAAQQAGLKEVPCLVEELSDDVVAQDNITMNIQREDIPVLELARMVKAYMEQFGKTQQEAGKVFGKSRSWVAKLLGFLDLEPRLLESVSILTPAWPTLEALKRLSPANQKTVATEMKDGTLKPGQILKRCNQLHFSAKRVHPNSHFQAVPPPPDPLADVWTNLVLDPGISNLGAWHVSYGPLNGAGLQDLNGWSVWFAGKGMDPKAELAQFFIALGEALGGSRAKSAVKPLIGDSPQAANQVTIDEAEAIRQRVAPNLAGEEETKSAAEPLNGDSPHTENGGVIRNLVNAVMERFVPVDNELERYAREYETLRLPKTDAEHSELQAAAAKSPQAMFSWLFGPRSLYAEKSKDVSWKDLQVSDPRALCESLVKMLASG